MFNLIKKDKERDGGKKKEKKEKEKKDKKERMSAAELESLEEMSARRGFFHLPRAARKDGRPRLEISSPMALQDDVDSSSLSNWTSAVPDTADDPKWGGEAGQARKRVAKFGGLVKQNSQVGQLMKRLSFSQKNREDSPLEESSPLGHDLASPLPQVEAEVSDTQRTMSLQRELVEAPGWTQVPELVGRTFPADLRLPDLLVPPPAPELRELELHRRDTGDFGFSLRRSAMVDHRADGTIYRRPVHFAEPGARDTAAALGLVPGDRLVEVNGRNVESESRDDIVEAIRQSGDTVRLRVQPIPELSELSRCWLKSREVSRREALSVKDKNKPGSNGSNISVR